MVKALCPVADGTEDIEFTNITDILVRAGVEVVVASVMTGKQVKLARGLNLVADCMIDEVSAADFDLVACAGGMPGAEHFQKSAKLNEIIVALKDAGKFYAAICATPAVCFSVNPKIMAGVTKATSYPAFHGKLGESGVQVMTERTVVDGKCVTSQGPATAMEFALKLVELVVSPEKSAEISKALLCA
eukprot:CAMPEP_0174287038 /NCGR_PEP_ID=MMETSP0809-20121228/14149_1 /TAXON_ID=73025 ORGANISM="Eutreptiella gymnastica-like, Strain CCMP1594" /NCGR_SAMPLE_ID=MMETSP0809 /ASSEMBLY_ACC=CAM_ASM_000658 /LENGTH=187 /DNA_ID=CAMNT_0015383371 /DNA_START=21 /DNA_END=584 /DNA_ORIENTATION=-